MKRPGDRERHSPTDSKASGVFAQPGDVGLTTGKHDLRRGIHIRYPEPPAIAAPVGGQRLGVVEIGADECRHSGWFTRSGGLGHRPPPLGDQPKPVFVGESRSCGERGVLAERVTGGCAGGRRKLGGQSTPERVGHAEERRLCELGPGELLDRALGDQRFERPSDDLISGISKELGLRVEQVGAHADALAPLAREEDGVP